MCDVMMNSDKMTDHLHGDIRHNNVKKRKFDDTYAAAAVGVLNEDVNADVDAVDGKQRSCYDDGDDSCGSYIVGDVEDSLNEEAMRLKSSIR